MDRLLWKPEEAAVLMGMGRAKVYELIADGTLPSVHVGRGSLRIPAKALLDWIDAQTGGRDADGGKGPGATGSE